MADDDIPHKDITYRIIGAAMRVHRRLPRGLKERHYQQALTAEMIKDDLTTPEEYHLEIYLVWNTNASYRRGRFRAGRLILPSICGGLTQLKMKRDDEMAADR